MTQKWTAEERKVAAAEVATYGPLEVHAEMYVYPDGGTCIEIDSNSIDLACERNLLRKALFRLKNEVNGWLVLEPVALAVLLGNTNVAVMKDRIEIAIAALDRCSK